MPWPERIFNGTYPSEEDPKVRVPIPKSYETELQVVINALKDMKQRDVKWESGTHGIGFVISDSLMFQRGGPHWSDNEFGHVYGLALPFVKRGMPIQPIQLENVVLKGYLSDTKVLMISYEGQKPMSPKVHTALAKWVKAGGTLFVVDNGKDPFSAVREWWNEGGNTFAAPAEHLFQELGLGRKPMQESTDVGKGRVVHLPWAPSSDLAYKADGDVRLTSKVKQYAKGIEWKESSALVLRRGPYVVASGMDESSSPAKSLKGKFVDFFDPELQVQTQIDLTPNTRHFLVDLAKYRRTVVASSGSVTAERASSTGWSGTIEGIGGSKGVILLRTSKAPKSATLDGKDIPIARYDSANRLTWLKFDLTSEPQKLSIQY